MSAFLPDSLAETSQSFAFAYAFRRSFPEPQTMYLLALPPNISLSGSVQLGVDYRRLILA